MLVPRHGRPKGGVGSCLHADNWYLIPSQVAVKAFRFRLMGSEKCNRVIFDPFDDASLSDHLVTR